MSQKTFRDFYGMTINGLRVGGIERLDKATKEPIWSVTCTKCGTHGQTVRHGELTRKTAGCRSVSCGKDSLTGRANFAGTAAPEVTSSQRGKEERSKEDVFQTKQEAAQEFMTRLRLADLEFDPTVANVAHINDILKEYELNERNVNSIMFAYKRAKELGLLQK